MRLDCTFVLFNHLLYILYKPNKSYVRKALTICLVDFYSRRNKKNMLFQGTHVIEVFVIEVRDLVAYFY